MPSAPYCSERIDTKVMPRGHRASLAVSSAFRSCVRWTCRRALRCSPTVCSASYHAGPADSPGPAASCLGPPLGRGPNTLLWLGVCGWRKRHGIWREVDRTVLDAGSQLLEGFPVEWFGVEVCEHLFGRAVFECKPPLFDLVGDVKILDVKVASALAGLAFAVSLQFDRAHVVLV